MSDLLRDVARCCNKGCPLRYECRRWQRPAAQGGPWGFRWADYSWEGCCEGYWPPGSDKSAMQEYLDAERRKG